MNPDDVKRLYILIDEIEQLVAKNDSYKLTRMARTKGELPYEETKNPEVTFKYWLPEHDNEVWLHTNAQKMYSFIWELDQKLRSIVKYEDIPEDHPRHKLAEEIRDMIYEEIDMNRMQ
jgi:hypothetical protein